MNNHPIGIIDSGIGGLSIWKEVTKLLPHESTIYLSDAKNLPYGEKSEEEIYTFAKRLVQYLLDQQVKLIVIACNTITVSALDRLRKDFPDLPIVGTVPVVKAAATASKNKRIGVISTNRTAQSEYQKRLIAQFASDCIVVNFGTNALVPMVEHDDLDKDVLRAVLELFHQAQIDTLALGCTHFPFLKEPIQQILGDEVTILDSGEAVARQVGRIVESNNVVSSKKEADHTFYTTGEKAAFETQLERLVGIKEDDKIKAIAI